MAALKNCSAGHKMTTANTYHRRSHGQAARECRECTRLARKKRSRYGYTRGDQKRLSQSDVIAEDISDISACPKCAGILRWGKDTRLEDAVSCIYCGWRPSAKVEMEL